MIISYHYLFLFIEASIIAVISDTIIIITIINLVIGTLIFTISSSPLPSSPSPSSSLKLSSVFSLLLEKHTSELTYRLIYTIGCLNNCIHASNFWKYLKLTKYVFPCTIDKIVHFLLSILVVLSAIQKYLK